MWQLVLSSLLLENYVNSFVLVNIGSSNSMLLGDTKPLLNSLAPGKFESNFRYVIFKRISVTDGWGISCEITIIWMSLDFTDDQSTLVQVMGLCRQGNKPLPEPMLTQICHHMVSLGHNELSQCWIIISENQCTTDTHQDHLRGNSPDIIKISFKL